MLQSSPAVGWRRAGYPKVSPRAYVHETAVLIGDVIVEDNVIIFPYAVLRADEGFPIVIGENTNVQDGVIMHSLKGNGIYIGKGVSIAHGAIIHGPCTIGDRSFIGFRAVLFRAGVGERCFVAHNALVTGVEIAGERLIPAGAIIDAPEKAEQLAVAGREQKMFQEEVLAVNEELRRGYKNIL